MKTFNDKTFFEKKHSFQEFMNQEMEQFKLHQSLHFNSYIQLRTDYLKQTPNTDFSLEFLRTFKPKIAVFAGSFNPFHKGHYNILQKAENIFDKVIVAFGQNPEKGKRGYKIPESIKNRQLESYDGLLTDFIEKLGHEVVVIRGLRNSTDFDYEQNQYRYIQELMPGIKIVSIFCDKEFEHISSSGIRTLEKFDKHRNYLLD